MLDQVHSRRQFLAVGCTAAIAAGGPTTWGQETSSLATVETVARGAKGVVATVSPLASQAAMDAFRRGGNAIDAAVAASLMLSVVNGYNSGLGGGGLAVVRRASGEILTIDGRETAPTRAVPEMFFREGAADPSRSQIGPLAVGVPGLLQLLSKLSREEGKIDWHDGLVGAAIVAEQGFYVTPEYASVLALKASELKRFPASAQVLLNASGEAWPVGHRLQQSDLARTLRLIAEQGVEWFYQGEFAERLERMMVQTGGVLRSDDLAEYECVMRDPVKTNYRQWQVHGFAPPSSGGIHIAQMLGMLQGFDVASIFAESEVTGLHLLLEVMKRAMADRAYWLGDADFARVPKSLIDLDYLAERAKTIDLQRATEVASYGIPPDADLDLFGCGGHTTHLATADGEGNVVALTQTINTSFGSKMIVPGTGVVLNNEMDDFSIAPGVRNAFGLVGAKANAVEPRKRPLSSMSPTIVVDADNRPVVSCGAAGGPKIITSVLQVLVRVLDLGETVEQAIAAPRVHQQWSPDRAVIEQGMPQTVVAELESMGHVVDRIDRAAVAQGMVHQQGKWIAAADPRVESSAMAR